VLPHSLAASFAGCAAWRGESSPSNPSGARAPPPYAKAGATVSLPAEFPRDFPLPPGAVVASAERAGAQAFVARSFVPAASKDTVSFFSERLPAAGYQIGEGDAEMDEAEAASPAMVTPGKWKLNGILARPDATALTLTLWKSE